MPICRVEAADSDTMPGVVLSNGIDANGRVIGFGCPDRAPPRATTTGRRRATG